jgi:transposase
LGVHVSDVVYMKAYSIDLRERILAVCDESNYTITQIANEFKVSTRWIYKLKQQRQQEGTIVPREHAGGRQPAFDGEDLLTLDEYVSKKPDATLQEIQRDFNCRISCSIQAIANALKRLGWRYKKNRYERVNKTERM